MVGGGIFAVLGIAAILAGGATPVSFFFAGIVALLTAYSYAKLTVAYPSEGGTVIFIDKAFGVDLFTGGLNNLLWLSYVVTLSLYAVAFANYAATFFPAGGTLQKHMLISGGLLIPAILNLTNPALISKTEMYVVAAKITALIIVIVFGFTSIDTTRIQPGTWQPIMSIIGGGMIIFVAYEGFELIANTAPNIKDFEINLPRAYYGSVVFVIALYVLISIVTVGALSPDQISSASDFALAEATRPSLGKLGFTLVAISAVLATFSAINATVYGSARLAYTIAEEGELPSYLKKKHWNQPLAGLVLTTILALLLANFVDLKSISTMGSAGFLVIFAFVNAANFLKSEEAGSNRLIAGVGVVACLLALSALIWHTFQNSPGQLWVLVTMVGISFAVEAIFITYFKNK